MHRAFGCLTADDDEADMLTLVGDPGAESTGYPSLISAVGIAGSQSFNNLAASVSGGRTLRFFLRAEF